MTVRSDAFFIFLPAPGAPRAVTAIKFFLLSANDSDIGVDPFTIRDTIPGAVAALCSRRAPEPDGVEIFETVGCTARIGQQIVTLASCRHGRDRAEPGCQVALQFRVERPFHPLLGAVLVW